MVFRKLVFHGLVSFIFDGHNALKAGATIKYLMGAGNIYAGFRDFSGTASITYDQVSKKATLNINSTSGTLEVINGGSDFLKFNNFQASSLTGKEAAGVGHK